MKQQDIITDLSALEHRAKGIHEWPEKNGRGCFEEQEHVDADTKGLHDRWNHEYDLDDTRLAAIGVKA